MIYSIVPKEGVTDLIGDREKNIFSSNSRTIENNRKKILCLSTLRSVTPTLNNGEQTNDNIHNEVKEGLDYILRHLDGYPSFPRNIMTKRLGHQIEVTNKETALIEYDHSNNLDCRIGAYSSFTGYKGLNFTAPSLAFIDLDLNRFKDRKALDRVLANTLGNIRRICDKSKPTVLWTGNGYHIYHPLSAFVLEGEQVFADFICKDLDMTSKFMRFAEQYLTNGKQDPNHKPSVKNCLLRIPGTYNSKNRERVSIVQEWNGYKTPIQYILREFRRYLIQDKINRSIGTVNKSHRE